MTTEHQTLTASTSHQDRGPAEYWFHAEWTSSNKHMNTQHNANVCTMQIAAYVWPAPLSHLSSRLSGRTSQTRWSNRSGGSTVPTGTRSSLFPRLTLEQDKRSCHQVWSCFFFFLFNLKMINCEQLQPGQHIIIIIITIIIIYILATYETDHQGQRKLIKMDTVLTACSNQLVHNV